MHQIRKYEENLQLALSSYAMSFKQATELEDDGLKVEQNGGSAHGAMEAFYRLHASRLKCLISAVDCNENERGHAETEALRLTECFWHSPPGDEILLPATKTRERVWRVLEDVVGALAKCSLDFSFFHRSVYRHAQALMWSPIIFDPVGGRACGSLVAVSATWACKIRGLNYATNAASSALSTMSALFSKKRPQLVAVWITGDGTASAFQAINNSVRKYDSLRGKYISAYIQCLRLCRRRKELDTFLSWTASICPRDLPSFFAASARNEGGKPKQTHMFDSLVIHGRTISSFHFLTSVRREANCSLASVILQDLKDITVKESSIAYAEKIKYLETQLKIAYVCFLRLNCGPDELIKISRLWKYHNKFGVKDVVDALTTAFVNLVKDVIRSGATSDWSGESEISSILKAAVHKCRELYPSISSSFSFSRQRASSKQKGGSGDLTAGSKRKRANGEFEKSYEAHVPEGLTEGETFVTSVKVGEYTKKLRLTVPSGSAGSLRFTLPPNL